MNWYFREKHGGKKVDSKKGASIFFTNGSNVLVIKRSSDSDEYPGRWDLPGGKANKGESHEECGKREALEEVGKMRGRKFGEMKNEDWVTMFYKVSSQFDCKLSNEHDQWKWIKLYDMVSYNMVPCIAKDIEKFIKKVKEDK